MMPASAKRLQRNRRDTLPEKMHGSSLEIDFEAELPSSPSRSAKRRRKTSRTSDPMERRALQSDEYRHLQGGEEDEIVSQVTQQLKSYPVQASKDHANVIHEANGDGVKAYAKVAAQDWTFYITKLSINIGRAPEIANNGDDENDSDQVHIDLGPSKMVSRSHAAIFFDSKDEKWFLQVNGRNGAKVDGQPVKSRSCHALTSGEVMEIGGVEMMFVLPYSETSALRVHSSFLQRCGLAAQPQTGSFSRKRQMLAPTPTDYQRPGTPTSTIHTDSIAKSPISATPTLIMGNGGADLSLDDNQHIKPQYSYAQMITQSILNAQDGKLNLNGIYTFIMNNYSYYRHQQAAGWQVRKNSA